MFDSARAFNANISMWETGQVTDMSQSMSTSVPHLLFLDVVSLTCFLIFYFFKFTPSIFRVHCVFYVRVVGSV